MIIQTINKGFKFTPVIVLAGQSNADGINSDPLGISPTALRGQGANYISNKGGELKTLLTQETSGDGIGQEFGLAYYLSQFRNQPVYIVKYGVGGTRLTVDGSEWNSNGGTYYTALMSSLSTVLSALSSQGRNPKLISFVWHQGESDALSQVTQATYETALAALITAWRNHALNTYFIAGNNVNVQIMKIHTAWQSDYPTATISNVRAAQQSIADSTSNVQIIDTDDLSLTSDPLHFNTLGQCTLSARTYSNIKLIR